MRDIAETDGGRLTLVFNPQWQTDGQIVSDFGCAATGPALFPHWSAGTSVHHYSASQIWKSVYWARRGEHWARRGEHCTPW